MNITIEIPRLLLNLIGAIYICIFVGILVHWTLSKKQTFREYIGSWGIESGSLFERVVLVAWVTLTVVAGISCAALVVVNMDAAVAASAIIVDNIKLI